MRTILHIGSDKTGSTALQFALAGQRAELRSLGVCYPKLDDRPDHRCLATSDLIPQTLGADCDVVVFSSEALWRAPKGKVRSIVSQLPPGPAQVVGYLREPGAYAEAAFLQRCRMCRSERELRAIVQLLKIPAQVNPIVYRAVRRFSQLQTWSENLSGKELLVLAYDPDADVVTDFCTQVGLQHILPALAARPTARQNPTLGLKAIHASVLVRERDGAKVQEQFLRFCAVDDAGVAQPMITTEAIRTVTRQRALHTINRFDGLAGDLSSLRNYVDRPNAEATLNKASALEYLAEKMPGFKQAYNA